MEKNHEQMTFYKYLKADDAIDDLLNSHYQWTPPILFNDPFDTNILFNIDFDRTRFANALRLEIDRLLNLPQKPVLRTGESLVIAIMYLWNEKRTNSQEEFEKKYKRIVPIAEEAFDKVMKKMEDIRQEIRRISFMFCVSEDKGNILMWSHYANSHKGVVFELKCRQHLKHSLFSNDNEILKIVYSKTIPLFTTLAEYIYGFTGQILSDTKKRVEKALSTKSDIWQHEKERRFTKLQKQEKDNENVKPKFFVPVHGDDGKREGRALPERWALTEFKMKTKGDCL